VFHSTLLHHTSAHPRETRQEDCQIFDALRKYDWDLVPINAMTSTPYGSKLDCEFGLVRDAILVHAYNLWISYPDVNTVFHANDANLASARSSITPM
jgi:hypothetical protein